MKKNHIFNQFFGIGDIMFIEPIMRRSFQSGHKVILPVLEKYFDTQKHFPYIEFIKKDELDIDYENQEVVETKTDVIFPVRWSREFFNSPLNCTMKNKYKMFDIPLNEWRSFTFLRDMDNERRLIKELNIPEKFNLINHNWHTFNDSHRDFSVRNGLKNIEMKFIPGYTLMDWSSIIERATTIHTVNTALLYLIETLDVCDRLYLYSRRKDGKDFKNTEYLRTKKYKLL